MPRYRASRLTTRRLFAEPGDPARAVRLGDTEPNWYRFAQGYQSAADVLVGRLKQRGVIPESVCLPILFLYRHYTELILKALLVDLGDLHDEPDPVPPKHQLLPLWQRVRHKLESLTGPGNERLLDRAQSLIAELEALDAGSFTFRYPVDVKGVMLLAPAGSVDMLEFRDVMAELDLVMQGAAVVLEDWLASKQAFLDAEDYSIYYQQQ